MLPQGREAVLDDMSFGTFEEKGSQGLGCKVVTVTVQRLTTLIQKTTVIS